MVTGRPGAPVEGVDVPDSRDVDSPSHRLPRVVVAAPASGHGKTTLTVGLLAALRDRGLAVAPAKVGPDYIDPGYHELACGRVGRNLDPVLVGERRVVPLLLHGALTPAPADVAVVEGVMGLYDGRLGTGGYGSTAHVAALTGSPVLLCVDVRHTSRTVGAVVHGLATYDPGVRVLGAVLNQAGSARHAAEAASAVEAAGVPVLGILPRSDELVAPSRHLGLVPAAERADARSSLSRLGEHVAQRVDLDGVLALARSAPPLRGAPWSAAAELAVAPQAAPAVPRTPGPRPVVALAGGRAFTFRYAETTELLEAAGCEVVSFDPLTDAALPEGTAGLYLGGGFPEVHARELHDNEDLRRSIRAAVAAGLPTVAECAGLLYLCEQLDDSAMVGALALRASMSPSLTLGYREATAPADTLVAHAGERVLGHEFHRTVALPADGVEVLPPAWQFPDAREGVSLDPSGRGRPTLHASYLHVHWAGHPALAARFAAAVHDHARRSAPSSRGTARTSNAAALSRPYAESPARPGGRSASDGVDLHHHGDRDLAPGLVDLAVNVRPTRTPRFLVEAVTAAADWAAYPDASGVPELVAAVHGVPADAVLLTAGAAEAFPLLARALPAERPVVVHPQFTEPEAALWAAGRRPARHVLRREDGFRLHPDAVPRDADLVLLGNPTNPTSVLHPAEAIERLRRAGPQERVVVVDEAFMDAVPAESESMIRPGALRRLLVVRSLTKTWGIAGLRAGYVVGDPELLARLAAQQPPWSVSTPALAAVVACLSPSAVDRARAEAGRIAEDRDDLLRRLRPLGVGVVEPAAASFVLVDTAALAPTSLVPDLAARGLAVRRGETFPGLGPTWIRLAVRDPSVHARLAEALQDIAAGQRDGADTTAPPTPRAGAFP